MSICLLLFVGVFMKRKNGFISISMIYSFFIIFLLLLSLIMTSYVNTRIRLNIYKKDIKKSYSDTEQSLFNIIKANAGYQVPKEGYRYTGTNPSNYISFNNEIWRIVGAVCKDKAANCTAGVASKYAIKLVRESTIKSAWDCKQKGVGGSPSENGDNRWRRSQLMLMLNYPETYVFPVTGNIVKASNTSNVVIYPSMGAYLDDSLRMYEIVTTTKDGFNSHTEIKKCVGDDNTDCLRVINPLSYNKLITFNHYVNVYDFTTVATKKFVSLEKTGDTNWVGRVSLLYASDICYGYDTTVSTENRDKCLKNESLATDSWLYTKNEWLLDAVKENSVLYNSGSKFVADTNLCNKRIIRPVVYLDATKIRIVGNNDGSKSQPFIIGEDYET